MSNSKGKRLSSERPLKTPAAIGESSLSRLALDIPRALHTRIKVACATQQRSMRDVLIEVLEQHFPADAAKEESTRDSGS